MPLKCELIKHDLYFKFEAGTSRGVLKDKTAYFLKIFDKLNPEVFGLGECSPLKGLSIDDKEGLALKLLETKLQLSSFGVPRNQEEIFSLAGAIAGNEFPSVKIALEMALMDLLNGGSRLIYKNNFSEGIVPIPINGLIWMGDAESMKKQVAEKIKEGFRCIKLKIGALDFENECMILESIREKYSPEEIELRLDANGAFVPEEALERLNRLDKYKIHSIEQPVARGQVQLMHQLCRESPIPVALDEELIGVFGRESKQELLNAINPHYIILKPTLLGGFHEANEWISIAEENEIQWWITSALESNIGLNALCQYAASFNNRLPQGLGTGQLFKNNIPSPLHVAKGNIWYDINDEWNLSILNV